MADRRRPRRPHRRWSVPGAVTVTLALAGVLTVGACAPSTPSDRPTGSSGVAPAGDGATPSPTPTPVPTPIPIPKHEVYGYLPYWEMDGTIAAHVAKVELTTLALFSVTHRKTGALATNQTGYKRITGSIGDRLIRDAHERGVRVEIVYTSFGEDKNRRFYDDPAAQARWIDELVGLAVETKVDGVNVDVERLPLDLVDDYGAFVGRLRTALHDRMPDGQVSVATTAGPRGAAMAAAAAAAGADRIFLMGYDYHWEGSNAGAVAPLEQLDGDTLDLVTSLELYGLAGVPVERLILGLPLYGETWPVVGPGVGSPATGRGKDWVPRRNLEVLTDPSFTPTYEPIESVEFYAVPASPDANETPRPTSDATPQGSVDPTAGSGGWNAVYYDSPRSLTPKLALADARGLAGAGFWAIGYERGLPGYDELIATFRAGELTAP